MMEGRFAPIDSELLRLTDKKRPRICVLPTPTGDAQEVLDRFYGAYDPFCDACQLTPFRKPTERSVSLRNIAESLSAFDAIFVTGGSTKSALGVWREWGIDRALRAAYEAGVLLGGMSAGAICWYEAAFTVARRHRDHGASSRSRTSAAREGKGRKRGHRGLNAPRQIARHCKP